MPAKPRTRVDRQAPDSREARTAFIQNARDAIGIIEPGHEVLFWTKGQFSLVHCLLVLLEQCEQPPDVTISTWTTTKKHLQEVYSQLRNNAIRSLRWLMDVSFPKREPLYCEYLRQHFGDDVIRVGQNHAKFMTIRTPARAFSLLTSMNLNDNPRWELAHIMDDPRICGFLNDTTSAYFEAVPPIEQAGYAEWNQYGNSPDAVRPNLDAFGADLDDPNNTGLGFM